MVKNLFSLLRRKAAVVFNGVLLLACGWLLRHTLRLEATVASLRAQLIDQAARRPGTAAGPSARKTQGAVQSPPASSPTPSDAARAPAATESAGADLQKTLQNEVVVSLGTVEDIGAGFARFYASEMARTLRRRASFVQAADPVTPEEELAAQRQFSQILGSLPEIANFQNNPDEYGRFFKSLLQTGAGLSDDDAGKVGSLMKARAEEAIALGLNNARKPADGAVAWEWKRDAFIEKSADLLNDLLPQAAKDRFPVNGALMEFLEMDFDRAGDLAPAMGTRSTP